MKPIPRFPVWSATLLLLASCASLSAGSSDRPNSYEDVSAQPRQRDPYNYLDPTIGVNSSPSKPGAAQGCRLQCGVGEHCDASTPVERCISDTSPK